MRYERRIYRSSMEGRDRALAWAGSGITPGLCFNLSEALCCANNERIFHRSIQRSRRSRKFGDVQILTLRATKVCWQYSVLFQSQRLSVLRTSFAWRCVAYSHSGPRK